MFDQVPVRVWLLLLIAVTAIAPARYVYSHIVHAPSRRDITLPAEDLSWRTTGQLARSLALLATLGALSIFIFTPAADQFAGSPYFLPLLFGGVGAWIVFTVVRGLVTGRTELLARGFYNTYEREIHPVRFWASMAWNGTLGALMFWVAMQDYERSTVGRFADACDSRKIGSVEAKLSACGEWIRRRPSDVDAYFERGLIFLEVGPLDLAVADLTKAHELDPEDPWPLANRGLAWAWRKNTAKAENDFAAARALDPTNPVMLRGEAILRMNAGDTAGAVDRLTASMVRDPDNLWALRTRSELYWDLGEHEKSIQDDRRWFQLRKQQGVRQ